MVRVCLLGRGGEIIRGESSGGAKQDFGIWMEEGDVGAEGDARLAKDVV